MSSKRDPIDVATQVVDLAVKAGASGADAYFVRTSNLSLSIRAGELESVLRAATSGLGLRLTVDGRTLLVHTTNTEGLAILTLVRSATEMARALPEPKEPVIYAPVQEIARMDHADPDLAAEDQDAKTARLMAAEKAMLAVPGVTKSGGVHAAETDGELALVNSRGLRLYTPFSSIEMQAEAIAERDGESYVGGSYNEVPARRHLLDPEAMGREAGLRATELLGAQPVETTRAPVVFTPQTGWTVLVCLSNALRGDNVVQDRSYFKGKLEERVAATGVTIRDNPLLQRGARRRPFDAEGTPSQDLVLIEDGLLRAYFTDLASAAKLGVTPTGNTHRQAYNANPEIGTTNFYLESGTQSPAAILKDCDRALMVTNLSGWWVGMSPVVDTFSSAAMGFWIEKGERVRPVKGVSIGGSLREMLGAIDAIGDDLLHRGPTATPTFRVAEMAISGV